MAKNVKGENLPAGKVAVVTVDDLGKGWKYNTGTKKIDFEGTVSVDSKTIGEKGNTGKIEVKLSEQEGNLLQKFPDGLYYGTKASAELAKLYVDAQAGKDDPVYNANGDPTGAGSKNKPFKTFVYAVKQAKEGTTRYIFLKTGQVHKVDATPGATSVLPGALYVYSYGPELDSAIQDQKGDAVRARAKTVKEKTAPIVEFIKHKAFPYPSASPSATVFYMSALMVMTGSFLRFDGIILKNNINNVFKKDPASPNDSPRIAHGCRILCQNNSALEFYRCGFDMEGAVTYEGVRDLGMMIYLSYTTGGESFPIWKFGFIQSEGAKIKVYAAIDVPDNLGCYFLGHWGWAPGISVDTSISLKDATTSTSNITNTTSIKTLTYRIYGATADEQGDVKILLAPKSDVSATLFDFARR